MSVVSHLSDLRMRLLESTRFGWAPALVVACAATACADVTDPDLPISRLIERQDSPFYYYFDERIFLTVDPRRVVLQTREPLPGVALPILRDAGARLDSVSALPAWPDHAVLWLGSRTTRQQALRIATRLWALPGVFFASPGYRRAGIPASGPITPGNRISVKLRSKVTAGDFLGLAGAFGARAERLAPFTDDIWLLQYPTDSPYTALEIAAAMHRHALVAWAAPELLSEIFPAYAAEGPDPGRPGY